MDRKLTRPQIVALTFLSVASIAIVVRTLVLDYALWRPLPYLDAWEFAKSVPSIRARTYGLTDLVSFANEHRIATTRLLMLLDLHWFDGTGILTTVAFALTLAILSAVLAFSAGPHDRRWLTAPIILALLLSIVDADNFASGFQVQFPLVDLAASVSLGLFVVACRSARPVLWLAMAIAAELFAMLSMASGVAVVIAAIPVAVLMRAPVRTSILFFIPSALLATAYFIGFHRIPIPASHDPSAILAFVIAFVGSAARGWPYDDAPVALGLVLGAGLSIVVIRTAILSWRRSPDPYAVWIEAFAIWIVLSGAMAAIGRGSMGITIAWSSRYAVQSLVFASCVFVLGWRFAGQRGSGVWPQVALAASALGLAAASTFSPGALHEWRERVRMYDEVGYALVSGAASHDTIVKLYGFPDLIEPALAFYEANGLGPFSTRYGGAFRPPLNRLAGADVATLPACQASLESAVFSPPHTVTLSGWAVDTTSPSDGPYLLVTTRSGKLMGFGRAWETRQDVASLLGIGAQQVGFRFEVSDAGVEDVDRPDASLVLVPERGGRPCRYQFDLPRRQ